MTQSKIYRTLSRITGKLINSYGLDILIGFVLASIFMLMVSFDARAQNVGVNNPNPNVKALLDLTSSDKGLLVPRMSQAARIAMFPAPDASAKGMLVYQTDFTQGFYYYDGTVWQSIANGDSGWSLDGNTGTSMATNFMGTSDSVGVIFKSNNKEVMRLLPNKKIGMGTATPGSGYSSVKLEVADETGANSDIAIRTATNGIPQLILETSGGTLAAPTVSSPGAWGGTIIGQVHDGNTFVNTAAMIFGTEGANTPGNVAGTFQFNTNKWGPIGWEKMRLSSIGNLGIGVNNPLSRLDVAGNTNLIADSNYRIGNIRVLSIKGTGNLFTGANAGVLNQTGTSNSFVGNMSGYSNTIGNDNTFSGTNTGFLNSSGSYNTFSGSGAGYKNNGSMNTYYGRNAGYNATTSNGNTCVGYLAGVSTTTGSDNTYLGFQAKGAATLNNSAAIGSNAYAGKDNAMVLGDTSVKVGIGNSFPDFPLSFQNKVGDKISLWGSTGNSYGFGIQASLLQMYVPHSNADIAFGFGTSSALNEKMRIKGNGKVGIGTSTPGNRLPNTILEIADTTGVNTHVVISSSNNVNYQQVLAFARTRGTYSAPTIVQNYDNIGRLSGTGYDGATLLTASEIQYHIDSIPGPNSMPGNITFHTNAGNNGSVCTERMRIDRNGNIGVNTSIPSAKLDLNGTFKMSDGTQGAGKVMVSDAIGNASWQTLNAGNINAWGLNGNTGTNPLINYIGTTDFADLTFKTAATNRMTITSTGKIAIGGSASLSSKVTINTSSETGLTINTGTNCSGLVAYANGSGILHSAVFGENNGDGYGIQGYADNNSLFSVGVRGTSTSPTGTGVEGVATDLSGINFGVKGSSASPAGFSGYFSQGKFYVGNGNAGFGTTTPATQVEINGGLSLAENATLTANAASYIVTVGNRSYFRINSNATPANRLITLSNGLRTGQILVIECIAAGGVNGIRLSDSPLTYNTNLATFHDMYENDVITLIWNGTDWLETSYSNN